MKGAGPLADSDWPQCLGGGQRLAGSLPAWSGDVWQLVRAFLHSKIGSPGPLAPPQNTAGIDIYTQSARAETE